MSRGIYFGLGFKNDLHLTLVYLGKVGTYKKLAEDDLYDIARDVAATLNPVSVNITGTGWLGRDGDVPVLLVDHEQVDPIRDILLEKVGRNQGTQWTPHITTPVQATEYPESACSYELIFQYGDTIHRFPLK